MTDMVINYKPLFSQRLKFIGLSTTKLLLKGVNIVESSNNDNIVSDLVCRNQNILLMKFLNT